MDENNNLDINNETDPMARAEEKLSDPAPEYPSVDDVAEELPPTQEIPPVQETSPAQEQDDSQSNGTYNFNAGPNQDYAPYGQGGQDTNRYGNEGYSNCSQFQGQAPKPESATLGILSLVFGIVSIVFFCSCFNILTGIFAIVFGIIQLVNNKHTGRGMAIAGIVLSIISIVGCFVFWGAVSGAMSESMKDMDMDEFWEDYKDILDDYGIDINGEINFNNDDIPGNGGDDTQQL